MQLSSVQSLLILIAAIVPGYIFVFVVRQINRLLFNFADVFTRTITSLVCSILLYGMLEACIRVVNLLPKVAIPGPNASNTIRELFDSQGRFSGITDQVILGYFLVGILWPTFVGFLFGHISSSDKFDRALGIAGANQEAFARTSWDKEIYLRQYSFDVEVILLDNSMIRGRVADQSSISPSANGGDIYLQPSGTCEVTYWPHEVVKQAGIWIPGGQIRSVTIFDVEATKDAQISQVEQKGHRRLSFTNGWHFLQEWRGQRATERATSE